MAPAPWFESRTPAATGSPLSPDSDVPPEIRFHIRSLYEKHKSVILDRHQTPEGLLQATTPLFAKIWKSAHVLNLDGIRGARKALRWCFDAYCILQAPWSAVNLKHLRAFSRHEHFIPVEFEARTNFYSTASDVIYSRTVHAVVGIKDSASGIHSAWPGIGGKPPNTCAPAAAWARTPTYIFSALGKREINVFRSAAFSKSHHP
ncbi:hypothetical protein B0H11DRAFT_1921567 [Mycena galericulata]|nr:hypothetical protein B0H11DRAFT_1921567 [Mycena galericulata]